MLKKNCSFCDSPMKLYLVKCPSCKEANNIWERFFFFGKVLGVVVAALTLLSFFGSYLSSLGSNPKKIEVTLTEPPLRFSFANNSKSVASLEGIDVFAADIRQHTVKTVVIPIRLEYQYSESVKAKIPDLNAGSNQSFNIVPASQYVGGSNELRSQVKKMHEAFSKFKNDSNVTSIRIKPEYEKIFDYCEAADKYTRYVIPNRESKEKVRTCKLFFKFTNNKNAITVPVPCNESLIKELGADYYESRSICRTAFQYRRDGLAPRR